MSALQVFFLVLFTTIAAHTALGQDVPLFPNGTSHHVVTLFPAENLDEFSVYSWKSQTWKPNKDPDQVFALDEDFLRVEGSNVLYLTTNRTFYNYHLIAEYKWLNAEKPRDSGIFVNATPVGSSIMALECNLTAATSKAPLFGLWGAGSTRQLIVDGKKISSIPRIEGVDLEKPVGEWNRAEIICDRDRFFFGINGQAVVLGKNPVPRAGCIMFQHNRGDILFGRVDIVDYDALSRDDAETARRWQNEDFNK